MGPRMRAPASGWPAPPPAPKKGRGLLVVGVIVLVMAIVGGFGFWFLTRDDSSSDPAAESADEGDGGAVMGGGGAPPEPLGIDDPRTPEPVESPGGDGGDIGAALIDVVQGAGFTCGRSEGYRAARISCHLTRLDGPTVQNVRIGIVDDEVTEISAEVEVDRPWRNLPTAEQVDDPFGQGPDYDVRSVAGELVVQIGAAVLPDAEQEEVTSAVGVAMEETTGEIDTSAYTGWVALAKDSASLELTTADDDNHGIVSTERPLDYLTAKQVEVIIEGQGFTCERGTGSSTCRAGDVRVDVHFPRPKGKGNHDLAEIEVSAPATGGGEVDPSLVAVATALSEKAVGIYGDADGAGSWVAECFRLNTHRISQGGATLTCAPEIEGTVESPQVTSYLFTLG